MTTAAIVLCCHKAGLAATRGLGRAGVPVIGVSYGRMQIGAVSRHLAESHRSPDPNDDEPAFVAWLIERASVWRGAVLVPTDDASLMAVSRRRDELAAHYRIAAQPWPVVRPLLEKRHTYELAHAHGIPSPRILVTHDVREAAAFAAEVGFPCLLKPSVGHEFFNRFKAKMLFLNDAEHLRRVVRTLDDYRGELMFSEFIPGDDTAGVNYNSLWADGRPVREFTAQKLRLRPTRIGFPTVVVSRWLPEVAALGRRTVEAFGCAGFSCTEFKRDSRDGVYKLMEVNARNNLSGALALACGINFPHLGFLQALGAELPKDGFRQAEGVRWIDETRELGGAVAMTKQGIGALRDYLRPYRGGYVSPVFAMDDPRPGLRRLRDAVQDSFGGNRPKRPVPAATATADAVTHRG